MSKGLFVGSFDPFTIGHASVVRRVLPLFDQLVIGVGINPAKQPQQSAEERVAAIRKLFAEEPRVEVRSYSGLTVDLAQACGAAYLVKGVRSVKDFEYEREQADINRQLTGIETILLPAEPGMESVSSSLVRQLQQLGRDVSAFLPTTVNHNEPQSIR